jgi:hypothetical protein
MGAQFFNGFSGEIKNQISTCFNQEARVGV